MFTPTPSHAARLRRAAGRPDDAEIARCACVFSRSFYSPGQAIPRQIGQFDWDRLMQLSGVMREDFDDPQTYKIIGAAMAVHRALGCGFLEAVSREAFTIELEERGIPLVRETRLPVRYRKYVLPVFYTVDFICYGEVLVELKALHAVGPIEIAQLINYLRVAGRSRGLLLNFGATSLQHKRLVVDVGDDPADQSGDA